MGWESCRPMVTLGDEIRNHPPRSLHAAVVKASRKPCQCVAEGYFLRRQHLALAE
jgi:hypothetical protein